MRLFLRLWVFLGVVGVIYSDLVKRQANGVESNSMSLEPGESHDPPVINIDDKPPGSGTDDATWSDDEDFSGDEPDDETDFEDGSGSGDLTVVPEPEPQTTTQAPKKPVKPEKPDKPVKKPFVTTTKATVTESEDKNKVPEVEDEITVEPGDKSTTMSNELGPGYKGDVEFSTGPPNALDPLNSIEGETDKQSTSFMGLLFSNPAILAAIIAGGVIALLAAILLVMFIVYRMRKKDEGSYSLDEPKKYKDPNVYWKDTGKEFYA
ncbi:syndecan-4-like [Glandiceps talaboti]